MSFFGKIRTCESNQSTCIYRVVAVYHTRGRCGDVLSVVVRIHWHTDSNLPGTKPNSTSMSGLEDGTPMARKALDTPAIPDDKVLTSIRECLPRSFAALKLNVLPNTAKPSVQYELEGSSYSNLKASLSPTSSGSNTLVPEGIIPSAANI